MFHQAEPLLNLFSLIESERSTVNPMCHQMWKCYKALHWYELDFHLSQSSKWLLCSVKKMLKIVIFVDFDVCFLGLFNVYRFISKDKKWAYI